jgi:hypothetical protein
MKEIYERVPQNDLAGIKLIKEDYDSEPAKGLIHGLQKDAIQNAVGAALNVKTFKDWKVTFELLKIKQNDALVFWDEGTTGLTGDILDSTEISRRSGEGTLSSDQNLARFLSVFNSGGNSGPGSYGRGKLVFQASSSTFTIVADSLREDGKYICFKRTIDKNNQLVQTQIFQDKDAIEFLKKETDNKLIPLEKSGTRIAILNLDQTEQMNGISIAQAFLNSFDEDFKDSECDLSFIMMLQETWWELLLKFNTEIYLVYNGVKKRVKLEEPLLSILNKNNNEGGWKVFERKNISLEIGGTKHRIKRLHFTVSPQGFTLPNNFQEIFVQRKGMKIGKINRGIEPNGKIKKRFCGYIEMEDSLQELMLEPENLTHSGYKNFQSSAARQIRQVIRENLDLFHKQLGIITKNENENIELEIIEALKDLNEKASLFGLMTSHGKGISKNYLEIKILDFELPNENSLRVEYTDTVGPVSLRINNFSKDAFAGMCKCSLSQRGDCDQHNVDEQHIEIEGNSCLDIVIDEFYIPNSFRYGEGVLVLFEIVDQNVKNSRMLWLGIEAPKTYSNYPCEVTFNQIMFPRKNSHRVELGESIDNIGFTLKNNTGVNLRSNISFTVRRGNSENKTPIMSLLKENSIDIEPLSETEFAIPNLEISEDYFAEVSLEPLNHNLRKCELCLKVNSIEHYPNIEIAKGQGLIPRKVIPFWIGIDEPGMSIFSEIIIEKREDDPRRSWFSGNSNSGFCFHFNQDHPAYLRILEYEINDLYKNEYYKQELLKQAYIICVQNESFSGLFLEPTIGGDVFSDRFTNSCSSDDVIITFEEIIGYALQKLYQ